MPSNASGSHSPSPLPSKGSETPARDVYELASAASLHAERTRDLADKITAEGKELARIAEALAEIACPAPVCRQRGRSNSLPATPVTKPLIPEIPPPRRRGSLGGEETSTSSNESITKQSQQVPVAYLKHQLEMDIEEMQERMPRLCEDRYISGVEAAAKLKQATTSVANANGYKRTKEQRQFKMKLAQKEDINDDFSQLSSAVTTPSRLPLPAKSSRAKSPSSSPLLGQDEQKRVVRPLPPAESSLVSPGGGGSGGRVQLTRAGPGTAENSTPHDSHGPLQRPMLPNSPADFVPETPRIFH